MQSSPDTPLDTPVAPSVDHHALGLGLGLGKAGGRYRDALEAGVREEDQEEEDVLQLPSVELVQRYMDRLELLGRAEDVEGSRDEMKRMASLFNLELS